MDVAEFDQFALEYESLHERNIAITGEKPEYFSAYKVACLRATADELQVDPQRILDFGAGIGNSVPHFRRLFPAAALTCADVSQQSLALAQARFPDAATGLPIVGDRIDAEDGTYDIAFSACVFHHIPHDEHVPWLRELRRIVRPGGLLAVFEHNPLNPLTVHAVNTCPFDANARLILARTLAERCRAAGWRSARVRYHVFFPRALALLRPLEPALGRLPLGAQYSVVAG